MSYYMTVFGLVIVTVAAYDMARSTARIRFVQGAFCTAGLVIAAGGAWGLSMDRGPLYPWNIFVLLGVGGAGLAYQLVVGYRVRVVSKAWPMVEGTIIGTDCQNYRGTFYLTLHYKYFAGNEWQYGDAECKFRTEEEAQKFAAMLNAMTQSVRVNPNKPDSSILPLDVPVE